MIFSDIQNITIPEGDVLSITDGNGTVIWEKKKKDPYTELQYIQANGTQYINTGINHTSGNIYQFNIDIDSITVANTYVMWSNLAAVRINYASSRYTFYAKYNGTSYNSSWSRPSFAQLTGSYTLNASRQLIVNGTTWVTASGSGSGTADAIKLFDEDVHGKIRSFSITRNNSTIMNLVPMLRNSDNVAGMYDTVSDTFFVSSGSNDFIAGPAV